MKMLLLLPIFAFAFSSFAMGKKEKCDLAAKTTAESFFDQYIENTRAQMEAELEPGEELDEDLLPSGLELSQVVNGEYTYSFAERGECACGFSVKTFMVGKKKNYCGGKVVKGSLSCEC